MQLYGIKHKIGLLAALTAGLILSGCAGKIPVEENKIVVEAEIPSSIEEVKEILPSIELSTEDGSGSSPEPTIRTVDWSGYFHGINGAAVILDPQIHQYAIYNQELADVRRSPCSTFKIISSLIALENGVIEPERSTRKWSGETFWNEAWNKDIGFQDAFRTSCVWYFREVVDAIGKEQIQAELDELSYGNCDISDWGGALNTNNNNPALTGFWIESSLKISAKEQAEVMERIFGDSTAYGEETLGWLKQVMLVPEPKDAGAVIYGKTGMGKLGGITVDCWFTGFADTPDGPIYYCVYLGETEGKEVTSAKAKEIAVQIISEYVRNNAAAVDAS